MRKVILTSAMLIGLVCLIQAQDYKTGIGLRGGFSNGLTIKHFIGKNTAVEGILDTRWGGFEAIALFEIHKEGVFDVDRLNFYYGAGGHIGVWEGNSNWGTKGTSYTVIGVDGILGLEYNFKEVPINISLDWKPAFNLIGYSDVWLDGGALSVRYIF
jgi:hypothetical protein